MANPWIKFIQNALTHPKHTPWIAALVVLGDAALCALVIWKISCKLVPLRGAYGPGIKLS